MPSNQLFRKPTKGLRVLVLIGAISLCTLATAKPESSLRQRLTIKKKTKISFSKRKGSEKVSLAKLAVLEKKRQALIGDIKKFMRSATDQEQRAELKMRLANLYMEDYYSKLNKAQQLHQKALAAYDKLPEAKRKRTRPPTMKTADYLDALRKSRNLYKGMMVKGKKHPRGDEILYFLASSSLDMNRIKEAMGYFDQLALSYKRSSYLNEALVQLGDYYFDNAKWTRALRYYSQLIKKRYKPLLAYAHYKKAWCEFNAGQPKAAIKSFNWVITREEDSSDGNYLKLRREAIRDIALPFVDMKAIDRAMAFYTELGEPHTRRGFETMAALYNEGGHLKQAIALWEYLLQSNRTHPKNPTYVLRIVEAYRKQRKIQLAISTLFNNLPGYTKNSGWYEINANKPEVVKNAIDGFELLARKIAFESHAGAQKMKNEKLYQSAQQLYLLYLANFTEYQNATQIRFYLGEILYKQKRFKDAAIQYYKVYKSPNAGKLKVDAVRYALNSLDQQLNADRKKAGLGAINAKSATKLKGDDSQLIPYSKVEASFIKIAEEYLQEFPNNKDAPDVLYTQAYLRYAHHELNIAYTNFWTFMKKYSAHPSAYSAAHLILDILNRKKNYSKLAAASKQFLSTAPLKDKVFQNDVSKILRSAELKRIQRFEKKGLFKAAAEGYVDYTKAYGLKDPSLYEKALYNAAVNFEKAKLVSKALETQEKFLRRFPKSSLAKNMLLAVASTYQKLGRFDKSAQYFLAFATQYPKHAEAKNALRLAGLFYWGGGKGEKAEEVMKRYLATYKAKADQDLVLSDLLAIYETDRDRAKQIAFYKARRAQGVAPDQYVVLSVKIADLLAQTNPSAAAGVFQQAYRYATKNKKAVTKTPEGKGALARIEFWNVARAEQKFYQIRLSLPQAKLQANLQKKIKMLNNLESEYKKVASIGSGEWAMGALYKTSAAYRHLAQSVAQAPVPTELTGEQTEMYRAEVAKNLVKPFEDKALTFSLQCVDKSQELNLLTVWVSKCYDMVGNLDPQRYPPVRTLFLPPVQTALVFPSEKEPLKIGKVRNYAIPVFSSGMFSRQVLRRTLASEGSRSLVVLNGYDENHPTAPKGMTYNLLAPIRLKALDKDLKKQTPGSKEKPSFAYLNLSRLVTPRKTIDAIYDLIEENPDSVALHNLLALTHIELNDLAAARVTLLSLLAKDVKHPALWNNLGVISMLLGKEDEAIGYYQQAAKMVGAKESRLNLGFLSLKYHNGFEAKKNFTAAIEAGDNSPAARVGLNVAQLQNREMDSAVEVIPELAVKYKSDPYARLASAYLHIDILDQKEVAGKILDEYMDRFFARTDPIFRAAYGEAKSGVAIPAVDDGLPELDL